MRKSCLSVFLIWGIVFIFGCGDDLPPTCNPGDYRCSKQGDTSGYCNSNHEWEIETCPNGCDTRTGWCASSSNNDTGSNEYSECSSGSYRCYGITSQKCYDGYWEKYEQCSGDKECNSSTGRCTSKSGSSGNNDGGSSNGGNNSGSNGGGCTLSSSIVNSTASSYFAYKGTGKIQSSSASSVDWNTNSVTVKFGGIPGKTKNIADKYSYFIESYISNDDTRYDTVAIIALDNFDSDGYAGSSIDAEVPIYFITDYLIPNNIFEMSIAPYLWFFDLTWTSDHSYLKRCLIASNKFGYNSDFRNDTNLGKLQVCYENNDDFSIGETFKVAFFAELLTGQNMLDDYGVDSAEDLCWCYNNNSGSQVACSSISW